MAPAAITASGATNTSCLGRDNTTMADHEQLSLVHGT